VPPGPYSIEQWRTTRMMSPGSWGWSRHGDGILDGRATASNGPASSRRHKAAGDHQQLAEPDVFTTALFDHWIALAERGQSQAVVESVMLFCFSPGYLTRSLRRSRPSETPRRVSTASRRRPLPVAATIRSTAPTRSAIPRSSLPGSSIS